MVDEVQVVSWSDGHGSCSPLQQSVVGLVQCLVHIHKGIDDGLPMRGRVWEVRVHHREGVRTHVLHSRGGEGGGK